jgi:hypothetical protein
LSAPATSATAITIAAAAGLPNIGLGIGGGREKGHERQAKQKLKPDRAWPVHFRPPEA